MEFDRARLGRALRGFLPALAGAAFGIAAVLWLSDDTPVAPPPKPPQQRAAKPAPPASPQPAPAAPSRARPEPQAARPAVPAPPTPGQKALAPRIAPAWQRFAVPAGDSTGRPRIAVVIDDMGVDRRRSAAAVALPGPLTLAFLPYARDLPDQTRTARAAGHELMVHMPMEPDSSAPDPGPTVLLARDTDQDIDRKMSWALSQFDGFVGVNNHMGSKFTKDAAGMGALMRVLGRRGLLFVDSRTSAASVGYSLARKAGVPTVRRDVFLDNYDNGAEVAKRLKEVEEVARRNGYAVAIGHPRDATLNQLAAWLPTLRKKGFALVPVSNLAAGAPG